MRTIFDLNNMKEIKNPPFESAYERLICTLEDYYIAKSDGKERIKKELNNWDNEARAYIIEILINRIKKFDMVNFDPNDLRQMKGIDVTVNEAAIINKEITVIGLVWIENDRGNITNDLITG